MATDKRIDDLQHYLDDKFNDMGQRITELHTGQQKMNTAFQKHSVADASQFSAMDAKMKYHTKGIWTIVLLVVGETIRRVFTNQSQ